MYSKQKKEQMVNKDPRELWYRLFYFVVAIYPIWFLWRPKTNDHVYHWFASAIQALYVADFALYYLLYSKQRSYTIYIFRDVVLNFTVATCFTLSLLEIVIAHPRPNFVDNQNGILESEQDANILSGWLIFFMGLLALDQLRLHRQNVFEKGKPPNMKLLREDIYCILAVILTILSPIPLIIENCSNFGSGCHDENLNGTVV
jgi:hypothetical protein